MSNPERASHGVDAQDEQIARYQQCGYSITATLDDGSVVLSKPRGRRLRRNLSVLVAADSGWGVAAIAAWEALKTP